MTYQPAPPAVPVLAPPPGWYTDPGNREAERWWTGSRWGEHTRNPDGEWNAADIVVPRSSTYATRALVWGIVAMALPIAFLPGILAIFFGAFAIPRETKCLHAGLPAKRTRAIVGLALGVAALVLAVTVFVVLGVLTKHPACGC